MYEKLSKGGYFVVRAAKFVTEEEISREVKGLMESH